MTNVVESQLADGTEITVCSFVYPDDTQQLFDFFCRLPPRIRNYLRFDVTRRDLLEKRLALLDNEDHWLLFAKTGGQIIAQAALDREPYGWTRHVAGVRSVVTDEWDNKGVRDILLHQIVSIAEKKGIERLYTEVQIEQRGYITRLEENGFVPYVTMPGYSKDLKGRMHDVMVMSNDLHNVWDILKERLEDMDIRMPNIHGGS